MAHTRKAVLLRDITAAELAMDSVDSEGYPAGHVIGHTGSTVTVVGVEADSVEVTDFSGDPCASGFVAAADIRLVEAMP